MQGGSTSIVEVEPPTINWLGLNSFSKGHKKNSDNPYDPRKTPTTGLV